MYKFQGVKVTRKRFWELAEIAKDLEILEQELDKEQFGSSITKIDDALVDQLFIEQELLKENELIKELSLELDKKDNLLHCKKCGSRFLIRNAKFGKYLKCSNINDCENVAMV